MGQCVFYMILIICECDNIVKVSYGLSSECDIVMFVIDHKVGWAWFANVNPLAIVLLSLDPAKYFDSSSLHARSFSLPGDAIKLAPLREIYRLVLSISTKTACDRRERYFSS